MNTHERETSEMQVSTIGLDIAKSVFQVHGVTHGEDHAGYHRPRRAGTRFLARHPAKRDSASGVAFVAHGVLTSAAGEASCAILSRPSQVILAHKPIFVVY